MPNHLADQSSPYLLQHANNPVDWYPWGPEAIERARREDKPIFLSIGYSACHWCHVMEHESFEDAELARLMNEHFVCIKVDREERPDLDQIYMTAIQLLTQRGGWPMSVFLTPGLEPFYGGTYWPPTARQGMPGFDQVLRAVADAWRRRREEVVEQAGSLAAHVRELGQGAAGTGELTPQLLGSAAEAMARNFDAVHGGFGHAPKFPQSADLRLLLRVWRRQPRESLLHAVTHTLDRMAAGGIHDQLGGGFHRYSVDERWLVPHFEKMLYDNAQLALVYLEAFLATGRADYAQVTRQTCDYVLREMTDPAGGFYSTQDADSEGVEGKFFVWAPREVSEVLGAEAARTFCYVYDVTEEGNFEHHNILHLAKSVDSCAQVLRRAPDELAAELAAGRAKLLGVRQRRVKPGRDDKVLVAWNGLMIDALAQAAGALDEPRYLAAAERAARFLLAGLRRPDGRLLHTWRHGVAKQDAFLDDYAALAGALVSLYEATFDERWIDAATALADEMLARFRDRERGGFFFTADDHESLIARQKDLQDNATPCGNSLAATALLRLARLTGRDDYRAAAEEAMRAVLPIAERAPLAAAQMLIALDFYLGPTPELVLLADPESAEGAALLRAIRRRYWPNRALALRPASRPPQYASTALEALFAGKQPVAHGPTLFVCERFACQAPVSGAEPIVAAIETLASVPDSSPDSAG